MVRPRQSDTRRNAVPHVVLTLMLLNAPQPTGARLLVDDLSLGSRRVMQQSGYDESRTVRSDTRSTDRFANSVNRSVSAKTFDRSSGLQLIESYCSLTHSERLETE